MKMLIGVTLCTMAFLSIVSLTPTGPGGKDSALLKMAREQLLKIAKKLSKDDTARIEQCCYGSMGSGNAIGSPGSNHDNQIYGSYEKAQIQQQCCQSMGSGNAIQSPNSNHDNNVQGNYVSVRIQQCCGGSMENGNSIHSSNSNHNNVIGGGAIYQTIHEQNDKVVEQALHKLLSDTLSTDDIARIEQCCYGSMGSGNAVDSPGSNHNNQVYGNYKSAQIQQQCCQSMGSGNAIGSHDSNYGNNVQGNYVSARIQQCCGGSMGNGNSIHSSNSNHNNIIGGGANYANAQRRHHHYDSNQVLTSLLEKMMEQ